MLYQWKSNLADAYLFIGNIEKAIKTLKNPLCWMLKIKMQFPD